MAQELELRGLTMVCEFVEENLALAASAPAAQRAVSLEVLQGWPLAVIEHLLHPEDDSRCIAVIDYLENETWPARLARSTLPSVEPEST